MVKKEKKIVCESIEDKDGKGEGYYFGIFITQHYEEDEWKEEIYDWYVYSNGTFTAGEDYMSSFEPSEHYLYGGTFDESKFNDYVEQMKEFKEDWEEELQYDEKQFEDCTAVKLNMVFDVSKYEEEVLNK